MEEATLIDSGILLLQNLQVCSYLPPIESQYASALDEIQRLQAENAELKQKLTAGA